MNADLFHTIQQEAGNVVVNIVKYTHGGREFKQKEYSRVGILDNGWIRCVKPRKRDDGKKDVDYYPPQNINGISSTEAPRDASNG